MIEYDTVNINKYKIYNTYRLKLYHKNIHIISLYYNS